MRLSVISSCKAGGVYDEFVRFEKAVSPWRIHCGILPIVDIEQISPEAGAVLAEPVSKRPQLARYMYVLYVGG